MLNVLIFYNSNSWHWQNINVTIFDTLECIIPSNCHTTLIAKYYLYSFYSDKRPTIMHILGIFKPTISSCLLWCLFLAFLFLQNWSVLTFLSKLKDTVDNRKLISVKVITEVSGLMYIDAWSIKRLEVLIIFVF